MSKRGLVLSGGASKGAFTAGVVYHLGVKANLSFDLAVGTSTGSLVGGPALLGGREFDYLQNVYTDVSNQDILGESFIEKILNGLTGTPIDANMGPLLGLLNKYYLQDGHLQTLTNSGKELVVTSVGVRTGRVHFVSSNQVKSGDIRLETFVRAILASCCEPVFTEPIRVYEQETNAKYAAFRTDLYYDGGIKDFLPLEKAVLLGADEIYAISTHPLKDSTTDWGRTSPPNNVPLPKAAGWSLDTLLNENARGDRLMGRLYYELDKAAAEIERLARTFNLSQPQIDDLVATALKLLPASTRLKALYMIAPDNDLPTSLAFDPHVMMNYFSRGKQIAKAFLEDQGGPEYVDLPWNDLNTEETFV